MLERGERMAKEGDKLGYSWCKQTEREKEDVMLNQVMTAEAA